MIAIGDMNNSLGAKLLNCRIPRTKCDAGGFTYEVILMFDDGREFTIDAESISVDRWAVDDK